MDDTDSEDSSDKEPEADNAQPWLHEWTLYTTTHNIVPENVRIVQWWEYVAMFLFLFSIAQADVPVLI